MFDHVSRIQNISLHNNKRLMFDYSLKFKKCLIRITNISLPKEHIKELFYLFILLKIYDFIYYKKNTPIVKSVY